MSKYRNDDVTSKDDSQVTGKQARKLTAGFRVAHPPGSSKRFMVNSGQLMYHDTSLWPKGSSIRQAQG